MTTKTSETVQIAGRSVGRVGYGCMGLTTVPAEVLPSDEQAFGAIKTAVDAGATFINTSTFYGSHEDPLLNLKLLNRFFAKYPDYVDKVFLSLKGGMDMKKFGPDGSIDFLRNDITQGIKAMPNKKIDLYQMGRIPHEQTIEEIMHILMTLRDEGLFEHIGLSEVSASTLKRALAVGPVAAVEIELSLWSMESAVMEVVKTCTELSIPIIAYSPLGRGFLTGTYKSVDDIPKGDRRLMWPRFQPENFDKNLKLVDAIKEVAGEKGITPSQLALAYILRISPEVLPIPGSSSAERTKANVESVHIQLSDADVKQVDDILASIEVTGDRYPKPFMSHLMK